CAQRGWAGGRVARPGRGRLRPPGDDRRGRLVGQGPRGAHGDLGSVRGRGDGRVRARRAPGVRGAIHRAPTRECRGRFDYLPRRVVSASGATSDEGWTADYPYDPDDRTLGDRVGSL